MATRRDEEILAFLESDDEASLPDRLVRMRFLLDQYGREGYTLFFGGVVPAHAFEEMRLCYLHGLYISCVVVAQIVIEHLLAGLFEMANRNDLQGASFKQLVEEALADGFISQGEFDELDHLRQLRNPYTHSKPIMHETCFIRRAAESGSHPRQLFKEDAQKAIVAVFRLMSRPPFSL